MMRQYWLLVKLISSCNGDLRYTHYFSAAFLLVALLVSGLIPGLSLPPLVLLNAILAGMFSIGMGLLFVPYQMRKLFSSPHFLCMPDFRLKYALSVLMLMTAACVYVYLVLLWFAPFTPSFMFPVRTFCLATLLLGFLLLIAKSPYFQFLFFLPLVISVVSVGFWRKLPAVIQTPMASSLLIVTALLCWTAVFVITCRHPAMARPALPLLFAWDGSNQFLLHHSLLSRLSRFRAGSTDKATLLLQRLPANWNSYCYMVLLPLYGIPSIHVLFFVWSIDSFIFTSAPKLYLATMVLVACGMTSNHVAALAWLRLVWLRTGKTRQQLWAEHEAKVLRFTLGIYSLVQVPLLSGVWFGGITGSHYLHLTAVMLAGPWFCYYLILFGRIKHWEWLLTVSFLAVLIPLFWLGMRSQVGGHHLEFGAFILFMMIITCFLRYLSASCFNRVDWQAWRPVGVFSRPRL